ncbi:TWiK family of potassium channels protein 18 [Operophtera brumata]|uniref:TWiK family of potassium channels protein 18 n=1 Tax=Operophtera brumata TaxID=104452 RepID=A0A0L7L5U5_OPEBR|nr:TWiK family of potassium channels protein 18 [Operophtera brumata]
MESLDVPPSYAPPPPPKRPVRPKITLQIPTATSPVAMTPRGHGPVYLTPRFHPKPSGTPGSHISDPHGHPYYNPFGNMYHNKASEFMFKQFEGFKDFTMNTAKSGLSAGEKSAFWFYNKLRILSKRSAK